LSLAHGLTGRIAKIPNPSAHPGNQEHKMKPGLVEEFRQIPTLADLTDRELEWLSDHSEIITAEPGDLLIRENTLADSMYIYLEGEMDGRRESLGPDSPVFTLRAGQISGLLPFSRMTHYTITARAITHMRVARVHKDCFQEMLRQIPDLGPRLVGILFDRVRETTKLDQSREKLASLGKLSAGLAHELNNPAAAGARAASSLADAFERHQQSGTLLDLENIDAETRTKLRIIEGYAREKLRTAPILTAMELDAREATLRTWFDAHHIEDGWQFAPTIAEAGIGTEKLDRLAGSFTGPVLAAALARITATLDITRLISDIQHSTSRISELVGAIKEYSFMDEAPRQEVDIAKGIEGTLVIMSYKLKNGINIVRNYDPDLPRIDSFGSELNQVWTNLIDNAADAMEGKGELRIRTAREGDEILVEFIDTGSGIAPEIQTRIFDPFFTTKPMGEGTGLGLDTVYRIVRKHRGNVSFVSQPGNTCFRIRLPIRNARL
jgi:signal transduction histidine kinase